MACWRRLPRTRRSCKASFLQKCGGMPFTSIRPPLLTGFACALHVRRMKCGGCSPPQMIWGGVRRQGRGFPDRGGHKGPDFFFGLRTALKDRPQAPPTANRQPQTASNRQPPTAANRHQMPTANHQPPPTTHCQPPTAPNCHQPPPTANRQSPPTMVEHMSYPRSFCETAVLEHFDFLFFPR